ncbi:MAG: phosphoglycerate kinase [bacterium]|nr:phosphoglycerate kinase [bacterium]
MSLPRLENARVTDQHVLVRTDFTAAVDPATGQVATESLLGFLKPTLELLLNRSAKVIIAPHCGEAGSAPSLEQVAPALSKLLGVDVNFAPKLPPDSSQSSQRFGDRVTLLENLLLQPGESAGDKAFAKQLAGFADLYVNDSFSACRHEYASVLHLPGLLPSYAGLHLFKEMESLEALLNRNNKPLVLILGGVRLEQKLKLALRFMEKIDTILVGGGLAYTFLKSRAIPVGSSFVEKELEVPAFQMIEKAELSETEFVLPLDHVTAEQFSKDSKTKNVNQTSIPERWFALDIGGKTVSRFEKAIKKAGCVFWYGPLGAIEMEKFGKGTRSVAAALAKSKAHTVATGVDTVRSIHAAGLADKFAHLSPDSGTALEFLMTGSLPGLKALEDSQESEE